MYCVHVADHVQTRVAIPYVLCLSDTCCIPTAELSVIRQTEFGILAAVADASACKMLAVAQRGKLLLLLLLFNRQGKRALAASPLGYDVTCT